MATKVNINELRGFEGFDPRAKMTNEWMDWSVDGSAGRGALGGLVGSGGGGGGGVGVGIGGAGVGPLGRIPLRGANHHNLATGLGGPGLTGIGGMIGTGGAGGGGGGGGQHHGFGAIHNNNNVSFLNNNQQSFLNSYSLNKLASVGMGLKAHPLMKGLQKPRGNVSLPPNSAVIRSSLFRDL